ncbi:MAG: MFS transporter [Hyphomicrobiales bacterium]
MNPRHAALLVTLMACAFLVVGQLYVTIPLVGAIAAEFDASPATAAFAGSAFGFAYALGFLLFGALSDRLGRRLVLVGGLIATAAGTLLVGLAPSLATMLAARAVQGLAASLFPPAALSLVAETLPPQQRPTGVAMMSLAFLGAAPLAQILAARAGVGLSPIMLDLAPLYLIGALAVFLAAGETAHGGAAAGSGPAAVRAAPWRDAGIVAGWAAAATVLFAFVSFHAGVQALGPLPGVDAQMLRLAGLPPLLLTLAAAPMIRRFGPAATARGGLVLAATALAATALGGPATLLAASALISAGIATAIPGLIALIAGRASQATRGRALAIYTFALFLGASLAAPVAQALQPTGFMALFLLPAFLLALGAAGLAVARRPAATTT